MEKNKLFIGSLPWTVTSESLKELFSQFGTVTDSAVIMDRDTGKSKGFGFITFSSDEEAQKALTLDGKEFEGRTIFVSIAKPREERNDRFKKNNTFGRDRRSY